MIKAEMITHEGNPGPNWLDHCRTFITPWTATATILAVAVIGLAWGVSHHHTPGQPVGTAQANTTSTGAGELHVAPLQDTTDTSALSSASLIQASNGSVGSAPATSSNSLGASATPSLNTTGNGKAKGVTSDLPNTLNKDTNSLLVNLQTILPGTSSSVRDYFQLPGTSQSSPQ